jgi:hypothetical protein
MLFVSASLPPPRTLKNRGGRGGASCVETEYGDDSSMDGGLMKSMFEGKFEGKEHYNVLFCGSVIRCKVRLK